VLDFWRKRFDSGHKQLRAIVNEIHVAIEREEFGVVEVLADDLRVIAGRVNTTANHIADHWQQEVQRDT
jgi:hypothetical protein